MKSSAHIGKLVFKLYMALIALLVVGVAVLLAPLFTCGDALMAVLRGDLDAALVCTAEDGQWMVSRSLLNAGANPNARCTDGCPLLPAMAARGDVVIVRMLLAKGADPAATDKQGRTALEIAQQMQNSELILLLEAPTATAAEPPAPASEPAPHPAALPQLPTTPDGATPPPSDTPAQAPAPEPSPESAATS